MERGQYSLVGRTGPPKTLVQVKLTDSVIQRLQGGGAGATLEFNGKTGNLCFSSGSGKKQECFKFSLVKSDSFENNTSVCKVDKGRVLENAGVVSKDAIRFEATHDTFNKVGQQFKNIQKERGQQSTVLLEGQFSSKQRPMCKSRKRTLLDDKSRMCLSQIKRQRNDCNKSEQKSMLIANRTNLLSKAREQSHVIPRESGNKFNTLQKYQFMNKNKNNQQQGLGNKDMGFTRMDVSTKNNWKVPAEPSLEPISSLQAVSTAHDQGYATDSDDSNVEVATVKTDNQYRLVYKDIPTEFLCKYKVVTSDAQRQIYKQHFHQEYPRYLKMHKLLEERFSKFCDIERTKRKDFQVSKQDKKFHHDLPNQTNIVNSFKYLYEKLRFIKYCVNKYDFNPK